MAVEELFIHPTTSAHPGLPLDTKVDLTQNGKESCSALRIFEVMSSFFPVLLCLAYCHSKPRRRSLAESQFTFVKLLLSKGLQGIVKLSLALFISR